MVIQVVNEIVVPHQGGSGAQPNKYAGAVLPDHVGDNLRAAFPVAYGRPVPGEGIAVNLHPPASEFHASPVVPEAAAFHAKAGEMGVEGPLGTAETAVPEEGRLFRLETYFPPSAWKGFLSLPGKDNGLLPRTQGQNPPLYPESRITLPVSIQVDEVEPHSRPRTDPKGGALREDFNAPNRDVSLPHLLRRFQRRAESA
jgi:hypothetical protein